MPWRYITDPANPLARPTRTPSSARPIQRSGSDWSRPHDRLGDDPVPADSAYQLIHDELLLDGSARLNLATFVTTWMEPQARTLMSECVDKNMIDKDEYPADRGARAPMCVDPRRPVARP